MNTTNICQASQITEEWLSAQLQQAGHDVRVVAFSTTRIGNGQLGSTYRITLNLNGATDTAPDSLILKTAGATEKSRRAGATGYGFDGRPGFFEQEVQFYKNYAPHLAIDAPNCLYAWLSPDGEDFALLLEDINPATPGDEFQLTDPGWVDKAVYELAGLHAPYWGNPDTDPDHRLHVPTSAEASLFASRLRRSVDVLRVRGLLPENPVVTRLVALLVDNAEPWFCGLGQSPTLVHGDFRMDNLMFAPTTDGIRAVAVDWQTFSASYGMRDIGQLLGASIPADARRRWSDFYLKTYTDRLVGLGVASATMDMSFQMLRVGVLHPVHSALALLRGGYADKRGQQLANTWFQRSAAAANDFDTWSVFK